MAASIASNAPFIVGLILILLLIAFATEIRPPEVTAIATVGILLVLGILSTDDLLAAMSNPAPLTIAAMFIISASLVRTGTLEVFAKRITEMAKQRPLVATAALLVTIAAMSAFTNNTPLVMMMIPIGITLAKQLGESSSKMLMPISFAAILGGTCTLIGTSTNILVDGVARKSGLAAFSIFEIAPAGIIIAIVGVGYIALTRRFLPDRESVASLALDSSSKRYSISVFIGATSPYIGRKLSDVNSLKSGERRLVDLIRKDESRRTNLYDNIIEQGDIIVLHSNESDIMTIREQGRLSLKKNATNDEVVPVSSHQSVLAEILLLPGANIIGQRLDTLDLLHRYGVYPIALHRRGVNLMERYEQTALAIGDTLLFEGAKADLQRLVDGENLMNMTEPKTRGFRTQKAPIAIAVIFGVVIAAAFDIMPIAGLAVMGMAAVLATRCIEPDEAFAAVDWRIIGLIVAMLAIGTALEKAGLVEIMVSAATPTLAGFPPIVALAAIYLLSLTLTELVTNNAVAVVVTPIAISLAVSLGADPRPFVIAVMFAASASFLTPIGYQTNTLVYGAGGYRFLDFARYGLPLTIIVAITSIIIIPLIWPL
ncbi:SLC13 family permease [Parasphingorhabdus sp.]|uniref:SLC13 family permease n=1 Tax=Parasphingorhabdus sp. TaxID=2709688 RepID=UPI0030032A2E